MLTDEQVAQFQILYKERFGKEISKDDALNIGLKLVRLMELIYQPITKNQFQEYEFTQEKIRSHKSE